MKKFFIKICKLFGFEIIDQNEFISPTLNKEFNKTLNANTNNINDNIIFRFKTLLIDYLNELIDFSMSFPFYRRLNPLFDKLFNKDTTLSIGRRFFFERALY